MITRKKTLIAVSALALRAAVMPSAAFAQVVISCPQSLHFGRLASCANNSKLTISPNGATSTVGCAIITAPATPATCYLSVSGTPPTKNIEVEVTTSMIDLPGNGGGQTRINQFRLQREGTSNAQTSLIFTPEDVIDGITINVGATLSFSGAQPLGSYTGQIKITANEI